MKLPDLIEPLSFEEILKDNISKVKELLPDYTPAQGDDIMLVVQDFSYREMMLREFINEQVRGNFLMTATGTKLDHLAMTLYGLERLQGSKPYTTATFTLSVPLSYEVTIPKGYALLEDGGIYHASTTSQAVIQAGDTQAVATIELDAMLTHSKVRTEIPVEQIPYLEVKQNGDFTNGGDKESDEEFRGRIRSSLSHTSTAGSRNSYIGYTYAADERIADVSVYRQSAGEVKVVYWSPSMDSVMQQRIESALSAEDIRPLTDLVSVKNATEAVIDISATLIITKGFDPAKATADARERIDAYFAKPQIGKDIKLSQIIGNLIVGGVEDVQLNTPTGSITIAKDAIALLGQLSLSTQESGDVY